MSTVKYFKLMYKYEYTQYKINTKNLNFVQKDNTVVTFPTFNVPGIILAHHRETD